MPRGPRPKPADQLANKTSARDRKASYKIVESEVVEPPELPEHMPVRDPMYHKKDDDGNLIEPKAKKYLDWPEQTRIWWDHWVNDPLTDDYRQSDWLDLLDCATVHGRLWSGDHRAAAELRLRMARHGATREDRARLRITFATADVAEQRVAKPGRATGESARERRGGLRSVN